ncbi:MAG: hypothetical protein M1835_000095 [Candelina submexicana]|nr:MAG: hypothetical protein M1835_000095 [Candelina submexicana]
MIDPFTLATGLVGIISLTIEVTKITTEYTSGFQKAPTAIADLQQELVSLTEVLQQLNKFLESQQLKGSAFHDASVLCATKDACERKIIELHRKLSKHNAGGTLSKTLRRLKWPLDEEENRQAVEDLHRYMETFQFSLNIDGCALLSKTSEQVSMTLITQLETLRETKKLALSNASLKDELDVASQLRIQILQVVASLPQQIETATADMVEGVEQLKATSRRNEQREIYDWLAKTDPTSNFNAARQLHEVTTGSWFIEGKEYLSWKTTAHSFLWLHGIPGSGKTVLSSTIVNDLILATKNQVSKLVAYYFFDFNDPQKQQVRQLIGSITTQVCAASEDVPKCLKELYLECRTGTQQPSQASLLNALRQMLDDSAEAYLVFDALDECSERDDLFPLIQSICDWELPHLHILATSRQERDIDEALKPLVSTEIPIQNSQVDADILVHVKSRMKGQKLKRWAKRQEVSTEIESKLVSGAAGMFRWAALQLDALEKCLTLNALKKTLSSLPKTLCVSPFSFFPLRKLSYATYDKILLSIDEEYRHLSLNILRWLAYSSRALTVAEVADVVAISYEGLPTFDPDDRFDDPMDILTVCSSLVTIETKGIDDSLKALDLKLAHFSVKEYLLDTQAETAAASFFQFSEVAAHTSIAEGGLTYLLHFVEPDPLPYLQYIGGLSIEFPLLSYVSSSWPQHLRVVPEASSYLTTLARDFFRSDSQPYLNWAKYRFLGPRGPDRNATPLITASGEGWLPIVRILIEDGADIHERSGPRQHNALEASALGGWTKVVEYLIGIGADPNANLVGSTSALQGAVWYNNVDVARTLLQAGADVHAKCGHYDAKFDNLLQIAAYWHHAEMVELLLDHGANCSSWVGSSSPYQEAILFDMLENEGLESKLGQELSRRYLVRSDLTAYDSATTMESKFNLSAMKARRDALDSIDTSMTVDMGALMLRTWLLLYTTRKGLIPSSQPTGRLPAREAEEPARTTRKITKVLELRQKELFDDVVDNDIGSATTLVHPDTMAIAALRAHHGAAIRAAEAVGSEHRRSNNRRYDEVSKEE